MICSQSSAILVFCLISFGVWLPAEHMALAQTESSQSTSLENAEELNNKAYELYSQGAYPDAILAAQEALSLYESALGPNHLTVAKPLNTLGLIYKAQANYSEALRLYERALSIKESTLGSDDPSAAVTLNNIASVYQDQGRYRTAQPLFERALSIGETTFGPNHPNVATSLNNLALLYSDQGDYSAALPLFERALSIDEATPGPDDAKVAATLNNIAALYRLQGNYSAALPLYERAIAIQETTLGPDHINVARTLSNLALLYQAQKDYSAALPLSERALSIHTSVLGPNHPNVAKGIQNTASLYLDQGDYDTALPLYKQAISIYEAALGSNHPDVATARTGLALLYRNQENYSAALPLYEQALSIYEAAFGSNHPNVAESLHGIAVLHSKQGNYSAALPIIERASSIEEENLEDIMVSASEERRQLYADTLTNKTDAAVSLSIGELSGNQQSAKLAASTILRRKGRVLDATSNSFQQLANRLNAEDRSRLEQLSTVRGTISNLQFTGLGNRSVEQFRAELQSLEAEAEAIEEQLARSSAAFNIETTPVTLDAVQASLPANAALIEFIRYSPYDYTAEFSQRWGSPRYAAYVITQQGDIQAVDLGAAEPIDTLIARYQSIVSTHPARRASSESLGTAAKALEEKVIAPLRPFITNKTHLLLSPDSQLNRIPFEALVDESNNYLIDSHQISYLTSGRDLLKLQQDIPSQQPPMIIANPAYGSTGTQAATATAETRSVDMSSLQFGPLPGTKEEADVIAPLLPNATLYTQQQATEEVLKQAQAPSILHIATHGFFLPDVDFIPTGSNNSRGIEVAPYTPPEATATQTTPSNLENPLLRSGLALAGFNTRSSGREDGVFTALEASGLNLYGTKLVVLSACETGVGAASTGEGVYGLRRAFTIAGAQSQLMSLWQVSDEGTAELMERYYDNLMNKGQGRSEALRNAQLAMMQDERYSDPFYWSAFIFSGDWQPIQ